MVFLKLWVGSLGFSPFATVTSGTFHIASGKSGLLSSCKRHLRIPLETQQGNRTSFQIEPGNSGYLLSGNGFLGILSSCIKGIKLPFEFREGSWDCSCGTAGGKGLISH